MAWEDEDFERFLKQFRLQQSRRTLPPAQMQRSSRLTAVAAAIVVLVGAAALLQYLRPSPSPEGVSTTAPIVAAQPPEPAPVPGPPPTPVPPPAPYAPSSSPAMPVLATDSEESGPPQRKLAPEAPILTTKVEIPVETASAATPVTQDNSAILDREAYIEYVNQYNRARRTQLEAEEEASRRLVERACGACHVPTLIGNSHWDTPVEYFDFVTRKVASGAQLTREEVPAVADYLFRMYGNQQQPEQSKTDVGKTVFDAACTQCHAADVMKNHAYAEPGRYRDIVADMIGKGATVPEPQVNPLVDYLLRTYGVKGRP